jgi:hypothetical protein
MLINSIIIQSDRLILCAVNNIPQRTLAQSKMAKHSVLTYVKTSCIRIKYTDGVTTSVTGVLYSSAITYNNNVLYHDISYDITTSGVIQWNLITYADILHAIVTSDCSDK